jgi:hypothetical protein
VRSRKKKNPIASANPGNKSSAHEMNAGRKVPGQLSQVGDGGGSENLADRQRNPVRFLEFPENHS